MRHINIPAPSQNLGIAACLVDDGAHSECGAQSHILERCAYISRQATNHSDLAKISVHTHMTRHHLFQLCCTASCHSKHWSRSLFSPEVPSCCFTAASLVEPMGQITRRIPYSQPQALLYKDKRLSLISGCFVSTLGHDFYDRRWGPDDKSGGTTSSMQIKLDTPHLEFSSTYDHRTLRTRLPVRSALFKQRTGGLVVRWVTTSEYPLLYVFCSFLWHR
jgi:hypothetical protein